MPEDEGRKLSELQPATGQSPEYVYGISSGLSLKFTPKQVVDAGRPFATEAEATAGARNDLSMSPLTTRAALDQYAATVINPDIAAVQANVSTLQGNLAATDAIVASNTARIAVLEQDQAAYEYTDLDDMLADTRTFPNDSIVQTRRNSYSYRVVASGGDLVNAGGARFQALAKGDRWEPEMFASNATPGVTPMTGAITSAINKGRARLNGVYLSSQIFITAPADIILEGTIRRAANAPTGNFVVTASDITITGGGMIDGNKVNTTTGCHGLRINSPALKVYVTGIRVTGCKAVSGWGDGISTNTGQDASSDIKIFGNSCYDNDGAGISSPDMRNGDVSNNRCWNNGGNGIFLNNFDTTLMQKIRRTRVFGNYCRNNGGSGIGVGNLIEDNVISSARRRYGFENMEAMDIVIESNVCEFNGIYGIAVAARGVSIIGNTVRNNGTVGAPNGGILSNSYRPSILSNVVESNIGYGIDAGGSFRPLIQGNAINWNTGTALTIECTNLAFVTGNKIMDNGTDGSSESSPGSIQVHTWRSGGDGNGNFFPMTCTNPHISGNQFILSAFRVGIRLDNGIEEPIVTDNVFWTTTPSLAVRDFSKWAVISGNKVRGGSQSIIPLSGTVLNVPDILEDIAIDPAGNPTISGIRTTSQAAIGLGLAYIDVVNAGSGYSHTTPPTVSITGGGGSGATAEVRLWEGTVVDIVLTARGTGYTSTPTVTITGGGGSGATGTAKVGQTMRDDKKLSILANSACVLAGTAADGPNIVQPVAGNITMPTHGMVSLIGRFAMGSTGYGQWRLVSKNF